MMALICLERDTSDLKKPILVITPFPSPIYPLLKPLVYATLYPINASLGQMKRWGL